MEKRVFADVIQTLEMRTFWIIQVDPKSHGRCPYKRDTERHQGEAGEAQVKTEVEISVTRP